MRSNGTFRYASLLVAGSLLFSSTAANAQASSWAAMSAFGTQASAQATCAAGASAAGAASAAATTAVQGAGTGCVLPVVDAAPVPVAETVPVPPPPMVETGGLGVSPLILALGALALGGLLYLILNKDKDNDTPLSPA